MINNSPFDDHIKNQFGHYKPEVPPHIWENIVAQKEKKKPAGILFFLRNNRFALLLFLFIATSAGALLIHNIFNTNPGKKAQAGEHSINSTTTLKDQKNIFNNSKNENEEEAHNQEAPQSTNDHTSSALVQNINSPDDMVAVKSSTPDNKVAVENENYKAVVSPVIPRLNNIKNKKADKKNTDGLLSKTTNGYDVKRKAATYSVVNDMNADASNNDLVSTKSKNKIKGSWKGRTRINAQAPETEILSSEEENPGDVTTTGKNYPEAQVKNVYLHLDAKPAGKKLSFTVKNINLPALNIPCPGGKNGKGNKYFEIYGGPDYAFRTFNDTANSTYLQKRKESTHVSSAFSFGLRYTKVFSNGISFRTGVNYSQINEKFKFEQGHILQLNYVINGNGDTTGSYATIGTRYKVTHNRYRTIDIPLIIGYEVGKERFRTNFNLGFIVNAYSWQRGDLLDSAYQPINITTGKSNSAYQFKTNVGLGITGGISFYYKLKGSMSLLAEPYFRYNFSAANKADITLKQKYTTLGLKLGLRIDF